MCHHHQGQVVGIIDTGLDWKSCYFMDTEVVPEFSWDEEKRRAKREDHKFEVWQSRKHRKVQVLLILFLVVVRVAA